MKYRLSVQKSAVIKRVIDTIDGESISNKVYSWPASNREIDLRVEPTDGGSIPLGSYSGVWAIFRLLSSADDHKVGTNLFPLVYLKAEGAGSRRQPILQDRSPIMFEVMQYPNDVRQAFDKDFFGVSCPGPKGIFE
jgi:hypothetical protein